MLLIWWDYFSPIAPACGGVTFQLSCLYACVFFFFGLEENAFGGLVYRGNSLKCQIMESGNAKFFLISYNAF